MIKKENESKFGDILAQSLSLEKANILRSLIKLNTVGHWVFVFKSAPDKYSIGIQNTWGAKLSKKELDEVKKLVKDSKIKK
jgi:hypothetical protein